MLSGPPSTSPWRGLSRREVRALLAAARAHSPRSSALISLLLLNGLRISEVLDARIEDLGHGPVARRRRRAGRASA